MNNRTIIMIATVAVVMMMGHASAAAPTFVSAAFTTDTNMDVTFATGEVISVDHTQFTSSNFTVTTASIDPDAMTVHVTISGLSSADQTDGLAAGATGLQLGAGAVANGTDNSTVYENKTVAGDTTKPTFESAAFTTDTNMDVVFSEGLSAAAHANFTSTSFTVSAASIDGTDAKIVHVTISGLSSANQTDGLSADANGLQLGAGAVTDKGEQTSDAAANNAVAEDTTAPTMSSAARVNNTHITVTMSESVTNLNNSSDGGFIVAKNGDPETTYAVSDIAAGGSANLVVLTVADISGSIAAGVKVTYNTTNVNGTITDMAENDLPTDTTGVIVAAWKTSSGDSTSSGGGTYPPGWLGTPTPTVTATTAPTASATETATVAPPGDKVTPAPTKKPDTVATTPAVEGTTAGDANEDTPGFTAVVVIAGVLAVAYLVMRRRE